MACLFIVDDDADNARLLAETLATCWCSQLEIICIRGLADFRKLRRRYKPDLVLVELLRYQSNGFTLAASIARQTAALVVLLADRETASDRLWASARGIHHVVSRHIGLSDLAAQLRQLMANCVELQQDSKPQEPVLLSKSLRHELAIAPEAALLTCIGEHVRLLPDEIPGDRSGAAAADMDDLCCLQNVLLYLSDSEAFDAVRALIAQYAQSSEQTSNTHACLLARERLLALVAPDAGLVLLTLCKDKWVQIAPMLHTGSALHLCADLLNALSFVPELKAISGSMCRGPEINVLDAIGQIQKLLSPSDEIKTLINAESLRVLGLCLTGTHVSNKSAWRELAGLCLMLRSIAEPQQWRTVLRVCIKALYGQPHKRDSDQQQLIYLILSMSCSADVDAGFTESVTGRLLAEVEQKLQTSLGLIAEIPGQQHSIHQRLTQLMVSVYKLRVWLELCAAACSDECSDECSEAEAKRAGGPYQRWVQLIGCLYNAVCHGVLQFGLLTEADIKYLHKVIQDLLRCVEQGLLPSENTLMNLAAYEITVARRSERGHGSEGQLLAAGLHRLPQPDGIMSDLLNDIKLCGTTLSEITHELMLLTEGAQRLGVGRVESMARLMLDSYLQIIRQPELLQRKSLRLALSRAHRVLCRVLDQAAAWLPLDQSEAGHSVPSVIDDLFDQFEHLASATKTSRRSGIHSGTKTDPVYAAWTQCQLLNHRLRHLIRHSDKLSDYKSLMTELLREQQAVMTSYLRYQSPD